MIKANTIKKMRQKGWNFSTPYSYDRRKINRFLNKEMGTDTLDKWKGREYTVGMKITTESVLIVANDKGQVVAMVRKDAGLQKNLIHQVSDASLANIEDLLSGGNVTAQPQEESGD